MPIGPVVPGAYVPVSADADPQTVVLSSVIAPSATMPVIGADLQVLVQAALNNFAAVSEPARVSTSQYRYASRADNRAILRAPIYNSAEWTIVNGTPALSLVGTTVRHINQIVPIPKGNGLHELDVWFQPAGGHGAFPGGEPASAPSIRLWSWEPSTGTKSAVTALKTLTYTTLGNYESVNLLRFQISDFPGGVDLVPDMLKIYTLEFTSEGGAGAVAGFQYNLATASYTITKQDPGST